MVDPRRDIGGDGRLQLLPQSRRREEEVWAHPWEQLGDRAWGGAAHYDEAHGHRQVVRTHPLGDVGHRQIGDRALPRLNSNQRADLGGHGEYVRVGELDALGWPGGTRSVDQRCEVTWL